MGQFPRVAAPVSVDATGQAIWKQDVGPNDELPLDLKMGARQSGALAVSP